MGALDLLPGCECGDTAAESRCGGSLPDSAGCAINYHFGMLLGVDDFRTEQGFHLGHHRRHQRWLHGFGVVVGMNAFMKDDELHVTGGFAIDRRGRDICIDADQCLSIPAWWDKHRRDEFFADTVPDAAPEPFDADVVLCARTCLSRPVPAISDPCAGAASEVAYSRICENFELALVPRRGNRESPPGDAPTHHLVRLLAGADQPAVDDRGGIAADDAWVARHRATAAALPGQRRTEGMRALWQSAAARATAAMAGSPCESVAAGDDNDCLVIAQLHGIRLANDEAAWTVEVDSVDISGRPTLLPTSVLQELVGSLVGRDSTAAPAGPVIAQNGASRDKSAIALEFDKPLSAPSVTPAAFSVSTFADATGWMTVAVGGAAYDGATRTVVLTLSHQPAQGALVRVGVHGSGPTPLLGADHTPFAAPTTASDGVDRFITI